MAATIDALRPVLKSQYHASLAMLKEAIQRCPEDVWLSRDHKNAFWQIAYHTLFFTHLYLGPDEAAFLPWKHHQGTAQDPDGTAGRAYTKEQVLEYCEFCDQMIDEAVDKLDLENSQCGFYWYKMSKLEHQLVSLRHIQHHGAQLADRLRSAADIGIRWVGSRPRS